MRFIGVLAWLALVGALSAATLSNPRRAGTGFEFSITGASNAIYAIQASTDLTNWTTVATNRLFGEVRTIQISSSAQEEFYRVRLLQPLFTGAMGARESIEFAGTGVTVVSFDSRDPRYFHPDGTRDRSRFSDRGDIITSSVLTNSLDLGNSKVFGVVRAPRDGLVVLGSGGSVGSIVWHLNGMRGIEPGHYVEETNRVFVDAEVPTGHVYVTPGPGSVDGTNYTYLLSDGHYTLPELRMGTSNRVMLVTGRATLYVSDFFALLPPAKIVIARDASLDVYVGAESATLGLSSVEDNNLRAAFTYYGLAGNTQVYVRGDGFCTGTIYAPGAAVSIGGGGFDEANISGAIVGRSIRVNGKLNMHYDEALGVTGPAW